MITNEDISSLNDNETDIQTIIEIKSEAKQDINLMKKIRHMKKISYLTRNTMVAYKNKLTFDISGKIIKKLLFFD